MATSRSTSPPPWPAEAFKAYEVVRNLGKGGFGTVYLARKLVPKEGDPDMEVAMKQIGSGSQTTSEAGYAKREVNILSELSHPHIVRLVDVFYSGDGIPLCIALSLARGPTLELMLRQGGALGLPMSREISKQLVDTISFLHGRAVIHRDIKPDNIIISRASPTEALCYSDGIDAETAVRNGKWSITLIDFGFARALEPSDIEDDIGLSNLVKGFEPDFISYSSSSPSAAILASIDAPIEDESVHKETRGRKSHMDVSKRIVRDLSALGNRSYAAPEILRSVRRLERQLSASLHKRNAGRAKKSTDEKKSALPPATVKTTKKKHALSACVSDYGMVADAFSLGATIRYMLTGVPPHIAVDEFLAMRRSIFAKARKKTSYVFCNLLGRKRRVKKYRSVDELPLEAAQLVHALTHWKMEQRTTVRGARLFPYVCDDSELRVADVKQPVQFLKCTRAAGEEP